MQVICKGHNTCEYKDTCNHSKPHEIISDNLDFSYNCSLEKDKKNEYLFMIMPDNCYCDHKFLRKNKLEKLNGKIFNL